MSATAIVINRAEFVYEMSTRPICNGTSRSIRNCAKGLPSPATVFPALIHHRRRRPPSIPTVGPPAQPLGRAEHIDDAGRAAEKEEHDQSPGPRPEKPVGDPAEGDPDAQRGQEFDPDAQAKAEGAARRASARAPASPPILLGTCPVDPLTKARQRVRRLIFAHREKRNQ